MTPFDVLLRKATIRLLHLTCLRAARHTSWHNIINELRNYQIWGFSMSKFLDDRELGTAITKLMEGNAVRCAVAFWGNGAAAKFFKDYKSSTKGRIVCDVIMGGSNPKELESMGAPKNPNLKHLPGLHAKTYISDKGLIVCSANASNNGIGFADGAALVEAGVFHPVQSEVFLSASRWFEVIWKKSKIVDEKALAIAHRNWDRRSSGNRLILPKRKPNPVSLFDMVVGDPVRFDGVGFAFTTRNAKLEDLKKAADRFRKDHEDDPVSISAPEMERVDNWPIGNLFANWPVSDIGIWPMSFICAHRPSGRLSYLLL